MEVRLPVAVGVLQEAGDHQAGRVAPLAGRGAVMAGAYDRGLLLHQHDQLARRLDQRLLDRVCRRFVPRGDLRPPLGARSLCRGHVAGVEQTDGLLGAQCVVVKRRLSPDLRLLAKLDLTDLLRRGKPAERGHCGLDCLLGPFLGRRGVVPGLALPCVQRLPVRADVVVVQGAHRIRVDFAGQAQVLGAGAHPHARRFPAGGQVVIGADLIKVVIDVETCLQRQLRHLSPPPGPEGTDHDHHS